MMTTVSGVVTDRSGNTAPWSVDFQIEADDEAGPFLPYAPDSFFKSRVTGAPVDATRTDKFRSFMKTYPEQSGDAFPMVNGIGASKWGTVYAEGLASDPIWKLTGTMSTQCGILRTQGFHAPAWLGDQLSLTSDSPFTVIDRASGFTVFGGKAAWTGPTTISVEAAGITYHTSNGLDYRNPKTTDQRNMTGRGRISDAMVIRRDLVDYGVANNTSLGHVLQIFLVKTDANTVPKFCHPMIGTEDRHVGGFGAEGERIAIAPSVDLAARGLTGAALVVARTLQEYGCYIGDNAGSASALKAEQDGPRKNWVDTNLTQKCLSGITWDDFVVVPFGWQ